MLTRTIERLADFVYFTKIDYTANEFKVFADTAGSVSKLCEELEGGVFSMNRKIITKMNEGVRYDESVAVSVL